MTLSLYIWYGLAMAAIVGLPLLAAWRFRGKGAAWRHFMYGGLVFLAAQAFRMPLVKLSGPLSQPIPRLALLALSAGIFEELGRLAGYRLLFRGNLSRRIGMMYGLGHGWMECLLVAFLMVATVHRFAAMGALDLSVVTFSREQLGEIRSAVDWWRPLAGGFERLAALPIHVMLSLMVLRAFVIRRMRWLAAAVGLHSAINFGIALTIRHAGFLQGEVLAAVLAAMSIIGIIRFYSEPANC